MLITQQLATGLMILYLLTSSTKREHDIQALKLDAVTYPEFSFDLLPIEFFLLLVFGNVDNVLSAIVVTRKSMRSNTIALMLTVLAVVETGVLWVDMFRNYLNKIHGVDFRTFSNMSCKLQR